MLTPLTRAIDRVERCFEAISTVAMLAIMLIVTCDVVLRYAVGRPIAWAYDLIGLYLVAGIFYFSISSAYTANAHIGVDILVRRLSPNGRRWSEMLTCALGVVLFTLIAIAGAERAAIGFSHGDFMSGPIPWPTWLAAALVPVGVTLLILRLLTRFVGHALSLATGRNVIPAPAFSGEAEGVAE